MQNLPWDLWLNPIDLPAGLDFEAGYDAGASLMRVTLRNRSEQTVAPRDIVLAGELDAPTAGGWAWLHGRYMQTDALVRAFGEPVADGYDGRYVRTRDEGRTYISREVMTLTLLSKPSPVLAMGCIEPGRVFVDFELDVSENDAHSDELRIIFDLDGIEIEPGADFVLPPVFLREGHDARALIEEYADATGEAMGARVPDHVPTGWCSWYYFYNKVSEADVVANLEAMVRDGHPAEYVQIDDGFQAHTGDWLMPNEKFPSGMKALADRIRESGYKPGLWLAPFILNEHSATLREHPDMVLKSRAGETVFVETWLGRCAVLDCTNPETEAWLRNVIRTVVREWGYVYLKLDACSYAAQPGSQVQYHVPGTTAPANLRRGFEIIREEAGDDTFIVGCTCHFGPAIGLVDAMRVGPDVKELWAAGPAPSVKHAMRLTLQRNWMHNRWWANDPDCLIVRDTDTQLNEAETRFLATGIALSGGMVVASDDLPKLPPARQDIALALFPPTGVAARSLTPGEAPVSRAWRMELGDGRSLVGVLNWSDESLWVPWSELLEPGEVGFDIWNRKPLPMGDVLLRPHEGTLWQVAKPGPTPRVVGDTGHVNYARLFQRPVSGRLQLRNDSNRARTVAIQHRGQVYLVDLEPGVLQWVD